MYCPIVIFCILCSKAVIDFTYCTTELKNTIFQVLVTEKNRRVKVRGTRSILRNSLVSIAVCIKYASQFSDFNLNIVFESKYLQERLV